MRETAFTLISTSTSTCIFYGCPYVHLPRTQSAPTHTPLLRSGDLLRDAFQAVWNFKKPGEEGQRPNLSRFTFRAMAAFWEIQIYHIRDQGLSKGAHIRIREEGAGSGYRKCFLI